MSNGNLEWNIKHQTTYLILLILKDKVRYSYLSILLICSFTQRNSYNFVIYLKAVIMVENITNLEKEIEIFYQIRKSLDITIWKFDMLEESKNMYSYLNSKQHKVQFVNAFDKLQQEQRRKLFGIPEIDDLLSFSYIKNICIVNRSANNNEFLGYFISKFCVDFCFDNDVGKVISKQSNNKTILIDAGCGDNLAHIYLHLVNRSLKEEFNIYKVLDNTIVVRAFTFYQLANIIINEIPNLIDKLACSIQIIVIGLLETLFSSSTISNNQKGRNDLKNLYEYEKLLNEVIDNLIHISDKHFVIVSYNDINTTIKRTIPSKFKNMVKLDIIQDIVKRREQNKDLSQHLDSKLESFINNDYETVLDQQVNLIPYQNIL